MPAAITPAVPNRNITIPSWWRTSSWVSRVCASTIVCSLSRLTAATRQLVSPSMLGIVRTAFESASWTTSMTSSRSGAPVVNPGSCSAARATPEFPVKQTIQVFEAPRYSGGTSKLRSQRSSDTELAWSMSASSPAASSCIRTVRYTPAATNATVTPTAMVVSRVTRLARERL